MSSLAQTARRRTSWRAVTALTHLERLLRVSEARSPYRIADGRLLWLFSDHEPRTLRQIAEELRLEQSTVNRQVNAAVGSGILQRFREPDQSAWHFRAAPEAVDEFTTAFERRLDTLDEALRAIPREKRSEFFDHLDAFVTAYDTALADH